MANQEPADAGNQVPNPSPDEPEIPEIDPVEHAEVEGAEEREAEVGAQMKRLLDPNDPYAADDREDEQDLRGDESEEN